MNAVGQVRMQLMAGGVLPENQASQDQNSKDIK